MKVGFRPAHGEEILSNSEDVHPAHDEEILGNSKDVYPAHGEQHYFA